MAKKNRIKPAIPAMAKAISDTVKTLPPKKGIDGLAARIRNIE
jgi:hypothetical protein